MATDGSLISGVTGGATELRGCAAELPAAGTTGATELAWELELERLAESDTELVAPDGADGLLAHPLVSISGKGTK